LPPHSDGGPKNVNRLRLHGRCGVDLGARLAIGHQAIHPDASGKRRLAAALRLLDVSAAEPPEPGHLLLPPEKRPDDERLGRRQNKWSAFELTGGEMQDLGEKLYDVQRGRDVPNEATLRAAL
jgi:hypothetical protein